MISLPGTAASSTMILQIGTNEVTSLSLHAHPLSLGISVSLLSLNTYQNTLLSISSQLSYSTQTTFCLQLVWSWSAPLVARNSVSAISCTDSSDSGTSGMAYPSKKQSTESRGLNYRSLLPGQSGVKDKKNSPAKAIKGHSVNTTTQCSTQNSTGCTIFYATANQLKLHQEAKERRKKSQHSL